MHTSMILAGSIVLFALACGRSYDSTPRSEDKDVSVVDLDATGGSSELQGPSLLARSY